jgi:hypothetical protein
MDEIGKRLLLIVVYVFVALALVPELAEQAGKSWVKGKVDACVEVMVRNLRKADPEVVRDSLAMKALPWCP